MINSEEFAKRLEKIIDFYGENASSFAEKIGVQRSSISHILSGRNKPSLEFVLKVLSAYPEVELYWLLNGKGNFPNTENSVGPKNVAIPIPPQQEEISNSTQAKKITRIVIFYSDGSFEEYEKK
ncbi:MAG: helix-turn-helix transcriptional regulator [Mangrovimonas sp.]|nr:helix-turn-helix transcriptional regulator [Mangrovimonas sp.]